MHRIIIPERSKDHAQPPPNKKPSCFWFTHIHDQELKTFDHFCGDWHGLFERFGPLADHLILNSKEASMINIWAIDGQL